MRKEMREMGEKNLDFDKVTKRTGTGSLKYDFALERGKPADVLPLWVADMDFPTSSYVTEALEKQVQHGIFGYSDTKEDYFEAVAAWMKKHHDWTVQPEWLIKTPGVVFALAMAIQAYTEPGDAVLIQQPVYYPFTEVIQDNGRRMVSSNLYQGAGGRYQIDFLDFEQKIVREKVKLFLLCSPHNPVGRVWSWEELSTIGDICVKHGVKGVCDEIHHDLIFQGKHLVFSNLKKEYEDITITCTSPSKTFNLAGLQVSNIFIPNPELRAKFQARINAAGYSQLNVMGLVGAKEAYAKGEEWYQGMLAYVRENLHYTRNFIQKRIPRIRMNEPEGTYLVWMDFKALGLSPKQLESLILDKAGLWVDSGSMFGSIGEGFERWNVACPRKTLITALEKLEAAVNGLEKEI